MLLDIAKLLLDKETRESFKEIVAIIKKKPEWKADLIEMAERFKKGEEHKARLFVQFSVELLTQKGWQGSRAGVAEFAIQEIVDNAFLHGWQDTESNGRVRIHSLVTSSWIRCAVTDNGPGFNLNEVLRSQSNGEGRGLATVKALAEKLAQIDANTIEVTIHSAPGRVSLSIEGSIYVIRLTGEFRDESSGDYSKLDELHGAIPAHAKVVVDVDSMDYVSSRGLRMFLTLKQHLDAKHCEVAMVVSPSGRMREILEISRFNRIFRCTETLQSAFELLR